MSLKPRTKETIKLSFAQLISNDACIMGGRERPWYFAIIFGLLAVVLAWIPIAVTYFTVDGSTILNSTTYGLDNSLIAFQEEANASGLTMVVNERGENQEHYLVTNFNDIYSDVGDPYFDVNAVKEDGTQTLYFRCYYYGDISSSDLTTKRSSVLSSEEYTATTMFITDTCFYIDVRPNSGGSYTSGSRMSVYGDYKNTPVGTDIASFATKKLDMSDRSYPISTRDSNWDEYYNESIEIWKGLFSQTYSSTALTTAATQSGISAAVFVAMLFFMGLMIVVMTRGKNNPFKIYTFWETQKIAYWLAFTPGLLGMILGFFLPTYAILFFVALLGVRTVWLTLKNLKPGV